MGASKWEDGLVGAFPKLATEGFEIVAPATQRHNCIAFVAVTPADDGLIPLWTTGPKVRHGQPLSPALKKLSPPSVSNHAMAAVLNQALRRSCCTKNKVNGHVLPCKLPAACGAAKWAPGLSLNTKIQSRCLVSYTETQRSTCDERRLPVVPPAPSELDLMQHNSPRMRIPFGVCRPTAKLQDKIGRKLSLLAPILA